MSSDSTARETFIESTTEVLSRILWYGPMRSQAIAPFRIHRQIVSVQTPRRLAATDGRNNGSGLSNDEASSFTNHHVLYYQSNEKSSVSAFYVFLVRSSSRGAERAAQNSQPLTFSPAR
jgi:hypothetical protein